MKKAILLILAVQLVAFTSLREAIPFGIIEYIFLFTLLVFVFKGKFTKSTILYFIGYFLFFLLTYLSSFINGFSPSYEYEIMLLFYMLTFSILIYLIPYINLEKESFDLILKYYCIFISCISVYFLVDFIDYYTFGIFPNNSLYIRSGFSRSQGFLSNPNYYSFSASLALISSIYLYKLKKIHFIHILILGLAICSALSRGTIISVTFPAVIIIVNLFFKKPLYVMPAFIAAMVFFLVTLYVHTINIIPDSHFASAIERRLNDHGGGVYARISAAFNSISAANNNLIHILFGLGPTESTSFTVTKNAPHNSFVRIYSEYGIFAFAFFCLMKILILLKSITNSNITAFYSISFLILASLTNDYFLVREYWLILIIILIDIYSGKKLISKRCHNKHVTSLSYGGY